MVHVSDDGYVSYVHIGRIVAKIKGAQRATSTEKCTRILVYGQPIATIEAMRELLMPLFGFIHGLDQPFFFILVVLLAALVVGLMRREYSLGLFIAVALTFIATHFLKNLFAVPRPDGMMMEADGYRFPSAHASITAAIAMSLALYGWRWLHEKPYQTSGRILMSAGAGGVIAMVNVSRITLNVHEPIDVFVGSLLGIVIAYAVHVFIVRLS
jgi:membrane-associated phospholipid phosphatase